MSHYRDNINGPRFPVGIERAHFSVANTTLAGLERQQRLWNEYWRRQCKMSPAPFIWYNPVMVYGQNPYRVPTALPPAPVPGLIGFGAQSSRRTHVQETRENNSGDVSNEMDGLRQSVTSRKECDATVEVLQEGNRWMRRARRKSRRLESYKTVNPVTEELDWNQFSPHLADGIVVSILDSFATELPVLDQADVQAVLEEIERRSPQPRTVHGKQMSGKDEYFMDIAEPEEPNVNLSSELFFDEITTQPVELLLNQQPLSIGKQNNVEPSFATTSLFTDPAYYVTDTSALPEGLASLLTTLDMDTSNGFQTLQQTGTTGHLSIESTVTPGCQIIMDEPAFETDTSKQAIDISSPFTLGIDELDWIVQTGSNSKDSLCGSFPQTEFFATDSNMNYAPFNGEDFLNGSNAQLAHHVSFGKQDTTECFWQTECLSNDSCTTDAASLLNAYLNETSF